MAEFLGFSASRTTVLRATIRAAPTHGTMLISIIDHLHAKLAASIDHSCSRNVPRVGKTLVDLLSSERARTRRRIFGTQQLKPSRLRVKLAGISDSRT